MDDTRRATPPLQVEIFTGDTSADFSNLQERINAWFWKYGIEDGESTKQIVAVRQSMIGNDRLVMSVWYFDREPCEDLTTYGLTEKGRRAHLHPVLTEGEQHD